MTDFDLDGWRFTKTDWWRATHIIDSELWIEILDGVLGVVDSNPKRLGGDYGIPLTVIDKLRELDDGSSVVEYVSTVDPEVMALELLIESCVRNDVPDLLKAYRERLETYLRSPERAAWEAANAVPK